MTIKKPFIEPESAAMQLSYSGLLCNSREGLGDLDGKPTWDPED